MSTSANAACKSEDSQFVALTTAAISRYSITRLLVIPIR
jgi:hypothetical protein